MLGSEMHFFCLAEGRAANAAIALASEEARVPCQAPPRVDERCALPGRFARRVG